MTKNEMNPYDAEFLQYDEFCNITYSELRNKIEKLRLDIVQANDPEVKAFAEKKYLEYRMKYFTLFSEDLNIQSIYKEEEPEV